MEPCKPHRHHWRLSKREWKKIFRRKRSTIEDGGKEKGSKSCLRSEWEEILQRTKCNRLLITVVIYPLLLWSPTLHNGKIFIYLFFFHISPLCMPLSALFLLWLGDVLTRKILYFRWPICKMCCFCKRHYLYSNLPFRLLNVWFYANFCYITAYKKNKK